MLVGAGVILWLGDENNKWKFVFISATKYQHPDNVEGVFQEFLSFFKGLFRGFLSFLKAFLEGSYPFLRPF